MRVMNQLDYQPLFGNMSPRSRPPFPPPFPFEPTRVVAKRAAEIEVMIKALKIAYLHKISV